MLLLCFFFSLFTNWKTCTKSTTQLMPKTCLESPRGPHSHHGPERELHSHHGQERELHSRRGLERGLRFRPGEASIYFLFLKIGPTPASFSFIFSLFKQTLIQILQQTNVKKCHVHPVIRTHDLWIVSLLP